MKHNVILILSLILTNNFGFSQEYTDFLGAGHNEGVTITSSDAKASAEASKSFDGSGLDAQIYDAGRFLTQATMGATIEDILSFNGPEDYTTWIEDQFVIPADSLSSLVDSIYAVVLEMRLAGGQDPSMLPNMNQRYFLYAWLQENITTSSLLRHKIAYALSQHFVISFESKLANSNRVVGISNYYDMLLHNAFGNFRDILEDVSFHPSMGYYLTHMNNSKSFPEDNIFPDENYAREIMQLFTIGLFMLNQDGTRQLDSEGNFIPTYDNDDINELARVFTGLGPGAVAPHVTFTEDPFFGLNFNSTSLTDPMVMYDFFHDTEEKTLPDGTILPETLKPLEDIEAAHDWLFNHPNTGPFFCRRMIQRMVKSNPTPEYIERVAAVFADDGNGVRGDMKAIIKAILLDEEARSADAQFDTSAGMLREPIMRSIGATRALPTDKIFDRYWDSGFRWRDYLRQKPMSAPTVFNHFLPDYEPIGEIGNMGLFGPEFQLHFTSSSIDYINEAYRWGWSGTLHSSSENNYGDEPVKVEYDELMELASSADLLINYLDKRLTFGTLSDHTRGIIRNALNSLNPNQTNQKARIALYLILMSAEYTTFH